GGVLRQVRRPQQGGKRDDRLYGEEQGLVPSPRRGGGVAQGQPRQEPRFLRQGLRGGGANQEDEGAAGAGRRPSGPTAADRAALSLKALRPDPLPDARPKSLALRLTPN